MINNQEKIKRTRGGVGGQQNFPEKVTGCNSWGKKVLPFGALPLELSVDL